MRKGKATWPPSRRGRGAGRRKRPRPPPACYALRRAPGILHHALNHEQADAGALDLGVEALEQGEKPRQMGSIEPQGAGSSQKTARPGSRRRDERPKPARLSARCATLGGQTSRGRWALARQNDGLAWPPSTSGPHGGRGRSCRPKRLRLSPEVPELNHPNPGIELPGGGVEAGQQVGKSRHGVIVPTKTTGRVGLYPTPPGSSGPSGGVRVL